jgi:putative phosphoesterase
MREKLEKALFPAKRSWGLVIELLVGLISDTHDRLPMVDKAVKALNEENVELVLHAGDYVSPFVIPRFKELKARFIGVFGNNDGDHEFLKRRFSENKRLEIRGNFAKLTLDGIQIALLHGSDEDLLNALIDCGAFDVVVHGHAHEAKVYRKGKTLIVNPGEVCGYLTGRCTIALLDTEKIEARILELG